MKNSLIKYMARLGVTAILLVALLGFSSLLVQADDNGTVELDLVLGGEGATPWHVPSIFPGDSGVNTVTLHNVGIADGIVVIWISELMSDEGINPEPETDIEGDGELDDYLLFDLSCDPPDRLSTNIDLPATIHELPQDASDSRYLGVEPLGGGETVTLEWLWELPSETGNEAQGDWISFTINYGLQGSPSGGNTPLVNCKWEQDSTSSLEDGDSDHNSIGTQLLPPVAYNGTKAVQYWAVVTNPAGVDEVEHVYVDVYYPEGEPEYGSCKHRVELGKVDKTVGISAFEAAWDAGLVTVGLDEDGNPYSYNEIVGEINEGLANVYVAQGYLAYYEPSGDYRVKISAVDDSGDWSNPLLNAMTYVGVAGFKVDFTVVNYGSAEVSVPNWIDGDMNFNLGDGKPTIRNIGNTKLQLSIVQDDMGFGKTSDEWNVEYGARMGAGGTVVNYAPEEQVAPGCVLYPGNTEEFDFSIYVVQAEAATYNGTMTLGCKSALWNR